MSSPKNSKTKPKYNMLQNTGYMIAKAWSVSRVILPVALGIILCGVAGNLLNLFVVPAVLEAVERGVSPVDFTVMIAWFTLALVVVHSLQYYLYSNTMPGRVCLRAELCVEVHAAFCRTSYPHTEDPNYIKLMEAAEKGLRNNSDASEAVWTTLTDLSTYVISFLFYLLLLANVQPLLAVLTAALAAVNYFAAKPINAWRYRHRDEEADIRHKLDYAIKRSQDIKLAKDIRIFGLGAWLEELFDKYAQLARDFAVRCAKVVFWADLLDVALTTLRNGAAYGWLVVMALRGELSPAEFVLYFSAVTGFSSWVTGIFTGLGTLHKQSLDLSALREYLEAPEPFQFEDGKPLPVKPDHLYTLELRDVSFRYPGADRDTISHLNLTIQPGEKLAVVGNNGAGKTTLIKILCGFYDPTEGQVLLDGQDIRQFNRRDYYRHFASVFQQFSVLPGSIAENVAQTAGDIDRDRVWECLDRAGLTEKIKSLPKGEDTLLERKVYLDAQDLSGGQMQRLMLARALYKGAPVVVLDEPTAALDPIAESDLYQKYNDMTRDCTSVYISHRLASTRFCDRILLIEDGGILEEGTHESLLAKGGRYAQLFNIQSQYYQEGEMTHA